MRRCAAVRRCAPLCAAVRRCVNVACSVRANTAGLGALQQRHALLNAKHSGALAEVEALQTKLAGALAEIAACREREQLLAGAVRQASASVNSSHGIAHSIAHGITHGSSIGNGGSNGSGAVHNAAGAGAMGPAANTDNGGTSGVHVIGRASTPATDSKGAWEAESNDPQRILAALVAAFEAARREHGALQAELLSERERCASTASNLETCSAAAYARKPTHPTLVCCARNQKKRGGGVWGCISCKYHAWGWGRGYAVHIASVCVVAAQPTDGGAVLWPEQACSTGCKAVHGLSKPDLLYWIYWFALHHAG